MKEACFEKIGFGPRYNNKTFDSFIADTNNKKRVVKTCMAYVNKFSRKQKGILLMGKPGTGKTHLCASICLGIIKKYPELFTEESPPTCRFINMVSFLNEIKKTYSNNETKAETDIIRRYSTVPLLFLDDLGKEYSKNNGASWADEKLYELINTRYIYERTTIVTTNLSINALETKTDPAIISRLMEMCVGLKCDWDDYRKRI